MDLNKYDNSDKEEKEIEVTISITLSKDVKIKTKNYYIEEGYLIPNDPKQDVENQIYLPQEAAYYLDKYNVSKDIINDLENWNVDDFIVVI